MQAVQDTLYDAFGQRQISTIFAQANQYRVVLEAEPVLAWPTPRQLLAATARAPARRSGDPRCRSPRSPPSNGMTRPPLAVTRQAQFPSVTLSFNLAEGASLGEAVDAIAAARGARSRCRRPSPAATPATPPSSRSRWPSEPWLIVAAVVVIYIVLGVLYESTIHPVTILSTLPSAGIGALLALMAVGSDLSLVALVGSCC